MLRKKSKSNFKLCIKKSSQFCWKNSLSLNKVRNAEKYFRQFTELNPTRLKIFQGKLRLWPASSSKFRCNSGSCVSSGSGSKVKNDGRSRYCCYLCDYSLCRACVERQDKLLTCLQNLCDKVTWTLLILILILVFILILILNV